MSDTLHIARATWRAVRAAYARKRTPQPIGTPRARVRRAAKAHYLAPVCDACAVEVSAR